MDKVMEEFMEYIKNISDRLGSLEREVFNTRKKLNVKTRLLGDLDLQNRLKQNKV